MDRDLSLEKHLLSRCYSSQTEIQNIIETRYQNNKETGGSFIVLLPTGGDDKPSSADVSKTDLTRNPAMKPSSTRKRNTRRQMKVYIKTTLASQKRLANALRQSNKANKPLDIERCIDKHNIPRYETYLQLNDLWNKYMQTLLFGDQKNPSFAMMLPKLSTADYNGCKLRVLESRDRNLVGTEGIVLYDAQHSFILVTPQVKSSNHIISPAQRVGGLRMLAKRGSLFGFEVQVSDSEVVGFTILGSRFEIRAVDRSSKKFKSHSVEDIY